MIRLNERLIERGLVTREDLASAEAARRHSDVLSALVRAGVLSEAALLEAVAHETGLPLLDPETRLDLDSARGAIEAIGAPLSWFVDHAVAPWRDARGQLHAAGPSVHDPMIEEALVQWTGADVHLHLAGSLVVEPVLFGLQGERAGREADPLRLADLAEEAPVIDFVNSVLAEALSLRASDVHFEPFEGRLIVRLRIDGILVQRRAVGIEMFDAVASRLKLLSGMNIAERRLPQDGRQSVRAAGKDLDVRVSSLPTTWGESIVVRLLGATQRIPELHELGLTQEQSALLTNAIAQPHGLVLVAGPTGSGKTTTVYRLLAQLNDGVRKIITIEDPVELDLPGVLQMAVRADIGLDFATGLRSVLRQDPDVIFVGEIRDSETAQTAIQAALTGHLVISTVHTNSALAAVARLCDLGAEPYLLADVLRAVVSQRLVRCVCPSCGRSDEDPSREERARALLPAASLEDEPRWRSGTGCKACNGVGLRDRVGVFEAVRVSPAIQGAIRARASEAELTEIARREGFRALLESGVAKARAGRTTLLEALRVLGASPT